MVKVRNFHLFYILKRRDPMKVRKIYNDICGECGKKAAYEIEVSQKILYLCEECKHELTYELVLH